MNKLVGLACFLVFLGAAALPFSPRPMPVFPATAISASRVLLLGVAAADKRAVAVGEQGVIVLSDDDGRNWRPAKSPTEATLTAVHFVDSRRGFAVGHDAVILMTEDAGETWKQVHAAPDEQKPLLAVWFENAERGIAVGAYSSFYRTSDGGKSWQAAAEFAATPEKVVVAPAASGTVGGTVGWRARMAGSGLTGSRARRAKASACSASPARMAMPSPYTTCSVGRPRRSVSLSIAGRSS